MAYPPKQFSVAELQTLFEEQKYPYVMDQEVIFIVDLNGAVITNLPKKVQIALPETIYKKYAIYAYDQSNELIVNQKYDIDDYQVEGIGFIIFPFVGQ